MTDKTEEPKWSLRTDQIVAILALLVAVAFGLIEPLARDTIFSGVSTSVNFIIAHLLIILLVIAIAIGAVAIWRTIAVQARFREMIVYSKVERGRWQSFKPLQYGYIPYQPLLREDENNLPIGLGVTLLNKLLGDVVQLKRSARASQWEEIDDQLKGSGSVAIFATPLIATFERTKSMAFSSPLFFSNMGLFVKREYADQFSLHRCTHDKMAAHIEKTSTQFLAIPGEISQNLAQRYISKEKWDNRIADKERKNLGTIFEDIAKAEPEQPLAVFCESIHAHFNRHCISGAVINILAPCSILYPVGFALCQGDYQLKNLINLRLMALSKDRGVLDICAEMMADQSISYLTKPISKAEVLEHYVDHWHVS